MVTSEGVRGQVEREARSDDDFQALREEVLSLRLSRKQQSETESSLIQELQRRCNRIIELEVSLHGAAQSEPLEVVESRRCSMGFAIGAGVAGRKEGEGMVGTGRVFCSRKQAETGILRARAVSDLQLAVH